MDIIPIISQVKSAFQAIFGDLDGARQTQENFSRQCPVIAHARCLTEYAIIGDKEAAAETLKQSNRSLFELADQVPIVPALVYYARGDKEGGERAAVAGARTIGTIGGGIVGFLVGGPVGAAAGSSGGGYVVDGIATGIRSAVHHKYSPSGYIATVTELVKDPSNPGKWFEVAAPIVIDAGACVVAKLKVQPAHNLAKEITEPGAIIAMKLGDEMTELHRQHPELGNKVNMAANNKAPSAVKAVHHEHRHSGCVVTAADEVKDSSNPGNWLDVAAAPIALAPLALDVAEEMKRRAHNLAKSNKTTSSQLKQKAAAEYVSTKLVDEMKESNKKVPESNKTTNGQLKKKPEAEVDEKPIEHVMSAFYNDQTMEYRVGHNAKAGNLLGHPPIPKNEVPDGAKASCAELQARVRAEADGINANSVATIHMDRETGKPQVMRACNNCRDATTKGLNVVTDNIPRDRQSKFPIPRTKDIRNGKIVVATGGCFEHLANSRNNDDDNDSSEI